MCFRYEELEQVIEQNKKRVAEIEEKIAANECEISLLRRRLDDQQEEERRCKQEAQSLLDEIQRVANELESEMKQRLSLENDKQGLEEELVFVREMHSKELEEMKTKALRDIGLDPSQFFKSELANAIRNIRDEFEALGVSQRNELDAWFRLKVTFCSNGFS